jgi:hypothetical protein
MSKRYVTNGILLLTNSLILSACGSAFQPPPQASWLADGSIAVFREVKSPPPVSFTPDVFRSFVPFTRISTVRSGVPDPRIPQNRVRISINRSAGTITVRGLGANPVVIPVEGADRMLLSSTSHTEILPSGARVRPHASIELKQESPLWYAPDSYFERRGLPVPPPFSHTRFRRGALGPFALFLTGEIPLHSAPFWSDEVGGLRVSEEVASALFQHLPLGATIDLE